MRDTATLRDTATAPTRPLDVAGLEAAALAATVDAAIACQPFVGRGDKHAADAAATEAMRRALTRAPGRGTVVIGEGEKDGAPMLYNGERVGAGGPAFDVAVDPLECTTFCAKGLPGSLATIALAEEGALLRPGPSHYMEKLVVHRAARNAIDITDPPELTAARVARVLGKGIAELRVVVLDKPRHAELIDRVRRAGASVATPSDGDVAGALEALLPSGEADLLMGVGGTPEGVMTACAARALGAGMQARLAPQSDGEARALAEAGLDADRVYSLGDLAAGRSLFVATGVTGGSLLARPQALEGAVVTESLVVSERGVRFVRGHSVSEQKEVG
ncbi:MAG: fructose-bisphosphatase class II family protein [Thermoleophilaceae bacterium]|nr:fructose-bisphosphatase class II family protein [Thermoleophilaceae bacterium]